MKIAFLHKDSWPPVEGSVLQSWQIYAGLAKNHTIYTPHTCPFPGAIHRYDNIRDSKKFIDSVDVVFIIVDGLFYFFEEKFSLLAKLIPEKKPVVWLLNGPIEESLVFPGYNRAKFPLDSIKRKMFSSFVNTCISVSKPMDAYAKKHLHAKTYTVVPNGADPLIFRPPSATTLAKRRKKGPFQVIWVGSGEYPWHAMDVISQLITKMSVQSPDVLFTLVVNRPWLSLPKLPNLRVIGPIEHSQLPAIYAEADLSLCLYHQVFPFGFYNSPLKLFESMAAGVPVIATNLGQISEVVTDHSNGFLTDNSIDHIISCIEAAKNNPALLQRMGKQARKTIESHYTWNHTVAHIEQALERSLHAE